MSLKKKWKSVSEGDPILDRVEGTFRNIDCAGWTLESVDEMDAYCIENSIDRKKFMKDEAQRMKPHLDRASSDLRNIGGDDPEPL